MGSVSGVGGKFLKNMIGGRKYKIKGGGKMKGEGKVWYELYQGSGGCQWWVIEHREFEPLSIKSTTTIGTFLLKQHAEEFKKFLEGRIEKEEWKKRKTLVAHG